MLSAEKYYCPNCNHLDNMKRLKAKQGEWKNKYFYTCNNNCKFYLNTNLSTNLNISNYSTSGDFYGQMIEDLKIPSIHQSKDAINTIKILMPDLIVHILGCTWGGHQSLIIREMIVPYLDDLNILKFVLKHSDSNGDKRLYKGYLNNDKYKMNDFLHMVLLKVKNKEIHEFIINEFGEHESDDLGNHLDWESKHLVKNND